MKTIETPCRVDPQCFSLTGVANASRDVEAGSRVAPLQPAMMWLVRHYRRHSKRISERRDHDETRYDCYIASATDTLLQLLAAHGGTYRYRVHEKKRIY